MAAQSAAEQDQSMEEILQSIKRIIADEEEDVEYDNTAEKRSAGSDVLELTEVVQEDGTTVQAEPESAEQEAQQPVEPEPEPEAADQPFEPVETAALTNAHQPSQEASQKESSDMSAQPAALELDTLLSEEVASATSESLRSLANRQSAPSAKPQATPAPAFRSGETVEDLVVEALRPMLKDWLDQNLPRIVEDLVEREVRRIAGN